MKKPGLYLVYGALRRNEENPDQPLEHAARFRRSRGACATRSPARRFWGHAPQAQWYEKRWFKSCRSRSPPPSPRSSESRETAQRVVGDSAAARRRGVSVVPGRGRKAGVRRGRPRGGHRGGRLMGPGGACAPRAGDHRGHRDAEAACLRGSQAKWKGCVGLWKHGWRSRVSSSGHARARGFGSSSFASRTTTVRRVAGPILWRSSTRHSRASRTGGAWPPGARRRKR